MLSKKDKLNAFVNYLQEKIKKFFAKLLKLNQKYPRVFQSIQLSLLYGYASLTLIYSVINCLGFCPEFIYKILPYAKQILSFPLVKFLSTPEKTFLLYFLAAEVILNGKSTSLLVKYNFVLIFILEMMQNLIVCLWDLFSHRDFEYLPVEMEFSIENALNFFFGFFIFFFFLYIYCYINSIIGKFVSFPHPFDKITDSAAFWLQLKRQKKRKKK